MHPPSFIPRLLCTPTHKSQGLRLAATCHGIYTTCTQGHHFTIQTSILGLLGATSVYSLVSSPSPPMVQFAACTTDLRLSTGMELQYSIYCTSAEPCTNLLARNNFAWPKGNAHTGMLGQCTLKACLHCGKLMAW